MLAKIHQNHFLLKLFLQCFYLLHQYKLYILHNHILNFHIAFPNKDNSYSPNHIQKFYCGVLLFLCDDGLSLFMPNVFLIKPPNLLVPIVPFATALATLIPVTQYAKVSIISAHTLLTSAFIIYIIAPKIKEAIKHIIKTDAFVSSTDIILS